MATTGGPIEVSITTSSSGEEITRFTDLNTGAVTETRRQQNLSSGPIEVEISSRPNGEEITRFTDSQGISTYQLSANSGENAVSGISPNQEDSAVPDPRLAGAIAAADTAREAAASISPNQEPGTGTTEPGTTVTTTNTFQADFDATFGTTEERNARATQFNNGVNSGVERRNFSSTRSSGGSFNISTFRAEVTNSDSILPTHSFLVVFSPMTWLNEFPNSSALVSSVLTMRCDNAILPAMNLLQEQNIRRYGFGPVENVAYGVNVGDFTLQFIVDRGGLVVDFFEAWMNRIVNRESYGGANMNNDVGRGKTPYEIAYKDTYSCPSVNVFIYDRAQNTVMEYNIYDVFPTGIQSMNMSWGEENTMMKLNVTFSFTDFRIRPKASAFGQSAPEAPNRPVSPVITRMMEDGNRPLVDAAQLQTDTASSVADLSNSTVVIGDGPDGALRTFGVPADTPSATASSPEVTVPTTRNAFGTPETIA